MKQIATQTPSLPYHFFEAFPEIWQFLEPSIRRYRCDKGETIIRHGDAAQALWVVQQGWVKLVRQTPDGKETVIGIDTEDDLFGEAALFPHANYPYTAESLEADTLLYTIPSAQLRQALKDHPDFSSRIMAVLNDRMSQTQLKLEQLHTMSATQRLGCFLLRLCKHRISGRFQLRIPIEKHILAAFLGMKPETLSRSQQQMLSIGVVIKRPEVLIEEVSKLRDFVCASCSEFGSCESEDESQDSTRSSASER